MNRKSRYSILAASLVTILLLASAFRIAELQTIAQQKLTTTTVADDKFGKGGTLETTSDDNFRVVKEVWKDKDGKIKETHSAVYNANNQLGAEVWVFGEDINLKVTTFKHPEGDWSFYGIGDSASGITKKQIEEKIGKIESEFIKTGTITRPQKPAANNAAPDKPKQEPTTQNPREPDQPSLPPTDVFTPSNKPKTETPSEKNTPPKTDKTSTGESGGNTAATPSTSLPPGYKLTANTVPGLDSWTLTTPFGGWRVNFPADVQPGELSTGTIFLDPIGKNDSERAQNLAKLKEHKLQAGDQVMNPVLWYSDQLYTTGMGRTVIRGGYRMLYDPPFYNIYLPIPTHKEMPPTPADFRIPTGGQQGGLFVIPGPFDGTLSQTDFVTINGERIPIISESPRSRVVWNTSKPIGDTKIEISENGQIGACPFHNVSVSVSATNLRLLRGQTATVTVTFTGLGKLNQDVPYDLVNHSPEVISMQGAEEAQNRMIPFTMIADPNDAKGGTYTDHVTITGVAPGPFRITATVRWKETCDLPPNAMHKQ